MYAVDIPQYATEEWDNVGYFDTREEALEFARLRFGADEEGRVGLVSEIPAEFECDQCGETCDTETECELHESEHPGHTFHVCRSAP